MREIKFRGKRVDNGEWIYGFYWHNTNTETSRITILTESSLYIDIEVIPETFGQFTGLTGKNGKEIYEGDICEVLYSSIGFQVEVKGVVYWGDWAMSYRIYLLPHHDDYKLSDYKSDIEVIGNIHDNPELLK